MASTYTSRGIELIATGEQTDAWGNSTNSNWSLVDQILSGTYSVSTTGGDTTLTSADAANLSYLVSGTLTSDATLIFPDVGGFYCISNATSGSFTLTVATTTGTGVTVQQGTQSIVYSDGTNMLSGVPAATTFVTGMVMNYFGTGDISGWVLCNSTTIGSASSGATQRANDDCQALFYLLWPYTSLTVSGGRGADAATDWAENKTITTPDFRGRVLAGLDGMGTTAAGRLTTDTIGSSTDTVGNSGGWEQIILTSEEMPSHTHTATADVAGDHVHSDTGASIGPFTAGGILYVQSNSDTHDTGSAGSHTHTITVQNSGSDEAHSNVQPTALLSIYIKL